MNTQAAHKFVTPISNEIDNLLRLLKQQEIPYPVELKTETRGEFVASIHDPRTDEQKAWDEFERETQETRASDRPM